MFSYSGDVIFLGPQWAVPVPVAATVMVRMSTVVDNSLQLAELWRTPQPL
ncbi:hypothetical protein [Streptomyces sp. NPDC093093]